MEKFISLDFKKISSDTLLDNSEVFYHKIKNRRTVREFSKEKFPEEILINIIKSAATAPSGANKQPWHFYIIKNEELKQRIRREAEKIEFENYSTKFTHSMKHDLKKLRTNYSKPFLEDVPYLIVMFKEKYRNIDGKIEKNYYVNESCGIALGIMLTAIHFTGLTTVTYTPSPMKFLNRILAVPDNYSPYVILPVGYPKTDTTVPDLSRKFLGDILNIL